MIILQHQPAKQSCWTIYFCNYAYSETYLWFQLCNVFSVISKTVSEFILHIFCRGFCDLWIWSFIIYYLYIFFSKNNSFSSIWMKTDSVVICLYRININLLFCIVASKRKTSFNYFGNLPFLFSDDRFSMRPSSSNGTSFTIHSFPRFAHVIGDQESVLWLSATNNAELPYHLLHEISVPPTPDPYHFSQRFHDQLFNHPGQDLRYHILRVNRINKSLQFSTNTRNRQVTRLIETTTGVMFEVAIKLIGLKHHSIPTSTQTKHRTTRSLFVVTRYNLFPLANLHLIINQEI